MNKKTAVGILFFLGLAITAYIGYESLNNSNAFQFEDVWFEEDEDE